MVAVPIELKKQKNVDNASKYESRIAKQSRGKDIVVIKGWCESDEDSEKF